MAAPTHYVKVKVEIKYTVVEIHEPESKPIKESRNQWTEVVKTEIPGPISQDNFVMRKHAVLGTIEASGL